MFMKTCGLPNRSNAFHIELINNNFQWNVSQLYVERSLGTLCNLVGN